MKLSGRAEATLDNAVRDCCLGERHLGWNLNSKESQHVKM